MKTTTIQDLCVAMNRLLAIGDAVSLKAAAAIAAVIASQAK